MDFLSSNQRRGKSFSILILIPLLLLSTIGIVTLFSTIIEPSGGLGDLDIVYKQILFILIGIILYFVLSSRDLTYLKHWQIIVIIYVFSLILLILTLTFGPTINYVKRWLVVGGIQIQPSEIAKLTVIILTAFLFSKKDMFNQWILFFSSFFLILPFVILIYLQPDASMAFLTFVIWFLIAFLGLTNPIRNSIILTVVFCISGSFLLSAITSNTQWFFLLIPAGIFTIFSLYSQKPWKRLIVLFLIIAFFLGILSASIWDSVLKDYQKDRIVVFFNPAGTEKDIGFNVNQSKIAIGSGKIFGKGFGNGTQSKRNFLPEHQTDFIFASYAEEFGLVGSMLLISLFGLLIFFSFSTAMNTVQNSFFSLLALGIGIKVLFEVFINLGTNLGIIPATGIPLPLISAGGSITVMTYISFALIQNIFNSVSKEIKDKSKNIVDIYEN